MPVAIDPLHIVIDVRRIRDFGIGTYIRNLTHALSRLRSRESLHSDRPSRRTSREFAGLGPNFRVAPCAPRPTTDAKA